MASELNDRTNRLEGLRTTRFPTERRGGYDRAAVDAHLADLADWLETDEAKAAIAQREVELVGERTGAILGTAQESADRITSEANAEAEATRSAAEREATEKRAAAETFDEETRDRVDSEAKALRAEAEAEAQALREAAESYAAKARTDAEEHARLTIREADDRLERAAREAEERTASIDAEIAGLAAKRDELVANLESLVAAIRSAIDGPGSEDLGLPERTRTAAAFRDEPVAHPEVLDAAPVGEADEEPARLAAGDGARTAAGPVAEFDTDEELYEDERPPDPVPSGRDPSRRRRTETGEDPPTDDQKLTELL